MRALSQHPSPALPCLTLLGSGEQIVEVPPIVERMARWPGGRLEIVEGGRHETLMDTPETQARLFGLICDLYESAGTGVATAATPRS
jgi:lysophospholipase